MTVSPRARRILAFTLFSASAGAFGSQGIRASKPHPNPNPRVPSPSLGSRNWQDCTLTAGTARLRGPSLCPLHQPHPAPTPQLPRPCLSPPCTWLPLAGSPRPLMEEKLPPALSSCQAMPEPAGIFWAPLAAPPGLACQQLHVRLMALLSPTELLFLI